MCGIASPGDPWGYRFQPVANGGGIVHHVADGTDELDDALGLEVAGRGLASENESVRRKCSGRSPRVAARMGGICGSCVPSVSKAPEVQSLGAFAFTVAKSRTWRSARAASWRVGCFRPRKDQRLPQWRNISVCVGLSRLKSFPPVLARICIVAPHPMRSSCESHE